EPNEVITGNKDISSVQEGLCHAASRTNQPDARLWLRRWERLRVKLEGVSSPAMVESTALHIAARKGLEHIAADLIKYGFDVNSKSMGSTPLHLAAENSHEGVIRLLVDQDADITIKIDNLGYIALHIIAYRGNTSAIQYLLAEGADINALDKINATPLHWASFRA
ncbi:ankyrin, partial [Glonium stellatum]